MAILDFLSKPLAPSRDIEDTGFSDWYSRLAEKSDINPDPDDPRHYYHYRAAYEAGMGPDERRHLPSKYKHDLHPNRYIIDKEDLSIYDTKYDKPAKFEDLVMQSFNRKNYEESIWRK